MKRILIPAILLAALLLGGYGCTGNPKTVNDAALAHLEQKYGEPFEYVSAWGSRYTTPGERRILVSCASLPDEKILVVIKGEGNTESYSDDYMGYYYAPYATDYIQQVADNTFGVCTVKVSSILSSADEDVTPNTTSLDAYIHDQIHTVVGTLTIDSADEATLVAFLDELKEIGVHFSLGITVTSTNEEYSGRYYAGDSDVSLNRRGA